MFNCVKFRKEKKGFSLIELIIVIAVIAIVGTIGITTYTAQIQEKRKEADASVLKNVETQIGLLLSYKSDFEEVKSILVGDHLGYEDTLVITLVCKNVQGKGQIKLKDTYIGDRPSELLKNDCREFYNDLVAAVGDTIDMQSNENRVGTYTITCVFDGAKISDVRDFSVTNDSVVITGLADFRED